MSGKFNMDDYVDVASREALLFDRHPDARIQVDLDDVRNGAGEIVAWKAKATIWRTPDDPIPVCDFAVEPVPGKTPYTRDSEAMNASTSAVGRAIILAGFPSKHIASADEVKARQDAPAAAVAPAPASPFQPPAPKPEGPRKISSSQHGKIGGLVKAMAGDDPDANNALVTEMREFTSREFGKTSRAQLTSVEASSLIDWLLNRQAGLPGKLDEDIPF